MDTSINTMDLDTCRAIALAQFQSEIFFFEDAFYKGQRSQAFERWEDAETDISFSEWCADNCEAFDIEPHDNNNSDYLVLTDDEADQMWDEYLENYIDDCILPELPEQYRCYFDNESFKDDARTDGRGHSLASYDGVEKEVSIKDMEQESEIDLEQTEFFIYRIN